jgi:hypothetical protein
MRILSRRLAPAESKILEQTYQEQRDYFLAHPQAVQAYLEVGDLKIDPQCDATDLASTAVVAGMLLCFDDFIMKR